MTSYKVTTRDLPALFKHTVGFDNLFNDVDRVFANTTNTYPPYNIVKVDDSEYIISIAVAGFRMEDLQLTQDGNMLTVTGTAPESQIEVNYLHKGIAGRSFERQFRIADHVEVKDAVLELGVLNITLKRNIPEELLPRQIKIR